MSRKNYIAFCIHDKSDMKLPSATVKIPIFSDNHLDFTDIFINYRGFWVNTSKMININE